MGSRGAGPMVSGSKIVISAALPGGDEAPVMQIVHQGSLARHPIDGVFQRHHLLFPDPVAQQAGAVVRAVALIRPRAAIGGADDRVG